MVVGWLDLAVLLSIVVRADREHLVELARSTDLHSPTLSNGGCSWRPSIRTAGEWSIVLCGAVLWSKMLCSTSEKCKPSYSMPPEDNADAVGCHGAHHRCQHVCGSMALRKDWSICWWERLCNHSSSSSRVLGQQTRPLQHCTTLTMSKCTTQALASIHSITALSHYSHAQTQASAQPGWVTLR